MEVRYQDAFESLRITRGLVAALIVTTCMIGGCGEDDTAEPEPAPPVATAISISPESVTLTTIGETASFTAAITDQYGAAFSGTVAWSSSATDVFTVDSNGTATAVANGSGTVTATHASLSATASVTVDANLPPQPRFEIDDIVLSVGGGPIAVQPTAFFEDPDNTVLELTFAASFSDESVASSEVVTDSEGHVAILLTGTAAGTTEVTVTATDPGGLSAEQSFAATVDDEGFTPFVGLTVSNNKIELSGLALVGRCSPPLQDFTTTTGFIFSINSSAWQSRSDSAAAWTQVEGTEDTEGRICPYTTTDGGEYRLVIAVTAQVDEHHDPFMGAYRSQNTFTVVDTVTTGNRAPVLSPEHPAAITLAAGGGAIPFLAARFFTDPDGDPLTFAMTNTDTAAVSAELVVDTAGDAVGILTGKAAGSSDVKVTATDPGGLSTDWNIEVTVDDSGATPWYAVHVANGVLIAFGQRIAVCMPPTIDFQSVDGNVYTVHESKWQTRSDSAAAWTDVDGTRKTDATVCPYTAAEPGDYRVVYEMSIGVDPHVEPTRGWYRSPNHFTVASMTRSGG